jgi:hypothetical protein
VIFQGNSTEAQVVDRLMGFSGHFGVVYLKNNRPERLYLGEGLSISYGDISLKAGEAATSAEIQVIDNRNYRITSNAPVVIEIGGSKAKRAELRSGGVTRSIIPVKVKKGIQITVPAGNEMLLVL